MNNSSIINSKLFSAILEDDFEAYNANLDYSTSNILRDLNLEDISSFGEELPLQLAALSSNLDEIESLIQKNGEDFINNSNNKGYTALHWACIGGSFESIALLASKGANFEAVTSRNESVLHWAARKNIFKNFSFALERSINIINQKNHKGFTAIHFSAANGNFDIFMELIKHGADIDIQNNYNATALHWATYCIENETSSSKNEGKQKIAEMLIKLVENKPNKLGFLNQINKIGKTALHWASLSGNEVIVNKLLDQDCSPHASLDGFTSAFDDLIESKFNRKIAEIYNKRGITSVK